MATLLHLAADPGTADLVIAAPFLLIVFLHRTCALWRDGARTRTYVARQAALRAEIARVAQVAQDDDARAVIRPSSPAHNPAHSSDGYELPRATASTPSIAAPVRR